MKITLDLLWKAGPFVLTLYRIYQEGRRRYEMTDEEKKLVKETAEVLERELVGLKETVVGAKTLKEKILVVPDVVKHVEVAGKQLKLAGHLKRELAVHLINRVVDVPFMPENIEAILIGFVVDAVVAAYNKHGKDWVSKIL